MTTLKSTLFLALWICFLANAVTANPPRHPFREACVTAQAQTDLNINKVRARLTTGGDLWWDRSFSPAYVVPASLLGGAPEVSAAGASGIWMGGLDPGGNLKLACQTYGNAIGRSDFYPGPLEGEFGTTSAEICTRWDRFFEVKGDDIREHLRLFQESRDGGAVYTADQIPLAVKGWPARGNPHFFEIHQFGLPGTDQGLADFWDNDGNGFYEPLRGDYPLVQLRGCEELPNFPDQIIFWIFNDEGGGALHEQTHATPIHMEVQAEAFAYSTNDPLDYTTFYKYKLINRALEDIDSTYFALWTAAELGCWRDDYIGCDTSRSMAYFYNSDAFDGEVNCTGYGTTIPALGINFISGPLDEYRNELGMSSFTYYSGSGANDPPPAMTPPSTSADYYNYLTGRWRDRTPYTAGGDGYNPGSVLPALNYVFVDEPNNPAGWSMCSEQLHFNSDYRTIQASGPFLLKPGAVNELIFSAVWAPNLDYPCPDLSKLKYAADFSQFLFDGCIHHAFGPDAPDVDWVEGDRQFVASFSNRQSFSNNFEEGYLELGTDIPEGIWDNTYKFEGYILYQLKYANVKHADLGDTSLAKIAAQVDVQNGIGKIYNWKIMDDPSAAARPYDYDFTYFPELMVDGADQGIPDSIVITQDLFATGSNRRLLNHRKYYLRGGHHPPVKVFNSTVLPRLSPWIELKTIITWTARAVIIK